MLDGFISNFCLVERIVISWCHRIVQAWTNSMSLHPIFQAPSNFTNATDRTRNKTNVQNQSVRHIEPGRETNGNITFCSLLPKKNFQILFLKLRKTKKNHSWFKYLSHNKNLSSWLAAREISPLNFKTCVACTRRRAFSTKSNILRWT